MRTLRAVLLIVGLSLMGECCYRQAISAGMTPRWLLGLGLSLAVFFGGAVVLVVLAWRDGRRHYSTDAGEREADRALEKLLRDEKAAPTPPSESSWRPSRSR